MAHALKITKSPLELKAERRRAAAERARGMLAHLSPGRSLSNALIAERRTEARAEAQAEKQAAKARQRSAKR